ncbi:type IX secretion system membrane protein PorP/SprF [Elusimicrobiota bacterium]
MKPEYGIFNIEYWKNKLLNARKSHERTRGSAMLLFAFIRVSFAFLFALGPQLCWGAFEDVGGGARPGAMGDAFTAVGGDIHSIYFNPAGLGMMKNPELATMYSKLFMGLSDDSDIGVSLLSHGQPLGSNGRHGTLGMGYWRLKLDSLFSETMGSLAYAKAVKKESMNKLYLGGTLKWLNRSFGTTPEIQNAINLSGQSLGSADPVLAKRRSKSATSVDLGALYNWRYNYSFGLSLQNINQPNMAMSESDKDVVPLTIRLGFSAKILKSRFSVDGIRRESIPGRFDNNLALGFEKNWNVNQSDFVAFRAGFKFGARNLRQASLGLGYQVNRVAMHYGFLLPITGIAKTNGTHQLALTFKFGAIANDEEEARLLFEKEKELRIKAEKQLKDALREKRAVQVKLDQLELQKEGQPGTKKLMPPMIIPVVPPPPNLKAPQKREIKLEQKKIEKEARKADTQKKQAMRAMKEAYDLSWNYYKKRVSMGASAKERMGILNKIISRYEVSGLDLGKARKELDGLMSKEKGVEEEYRRSWDYYTKIVEHGASSGTRIEMLKRIIKKFEKHNVDLTRVKEELKKLE